VFDGSEITGSTIVIGTLPECHIQLDGTDVSPRHAEIYGTKIGNETAAYVNSCDGQVSLNGAPPQMLQGTRLSDGDVIKVGEYAITIRYIPDPDLSDDITPYEFQVEKVG
jgi:pSer/pThr/pTyr-binding forkhead associated (FHA) protein